MSVSAAGAETPALAMASTNCYSAGMSFDKIRRLSTLLMAVVLAVGLVTHGVGGPNIVAKSAMTAAHDMPMSGDMPMPGKCDGCAGDEKGVVPTACDAFCGAVITIPLAVILHAVPDEILNLAPETDPIGQTVPPDPYPPRPTILS